MACENNLKISIRKFEEKDIENKVKWINDERNNRFLHYDLPLIYENTLTWYKRIKDLETRYDAVIECDGVPVGLIGLLSVDYKNLKAEYYICLGEQDYKGRGIAKTASKLLIDYGFEKLGLNKIYLYTEEENVGAQKLFEKLGFEKEGFFRDDLIYNGRKINRYAYALLKEV